MNFPMPSTAARRFFELPELVTHLALHFLLDHKSISCLMRTSRQLREFLAPALYYNVYSSYKPNKRTLLSSKKSIRVLARNAHHVRQLELNHLDLTYYMQCVFASQDQMSTPLPPSPARVVVIGVQEAYEEEEGQEEGRREQGRVMVSRRPQWLAPPDLRVCTVFPVPLMTRLTRLDLDLNNLILSNGCPYFLANFKWNPRATLTQTCWLLDSNPHLRVLRLSKVLMKDHRDTQLLTNSIFGLKQLQDAEFGFVRCQDEYEDEEVGGRWGSKSTRGLALAIFFACPPSLSRFSFDVKEKYLFQLEDVTEEYWKVDPGKPQSWELRDDDDDKREYEMMMTAPHWLRKEPLKRLTSLRLQRVGKENLSEDEFRSILEHCPNLTDIILPDIMPVKNTRSFALDIAHRLCPRLTILEKAQPAVNRTSWALAVQILNALPEHQVQIFRCHEESFAIPKMLNSMFRRHSQTLREIDLWSSWNIDSLAVQIMLVECLALERLDAQTGRRGCDGVEELLNRRQISIDLKDAVEFPWGCTRIQYLQLTIAIPGSYGNNQPSSPTTVTTAEDTKTAPFQLLESLYRQLGALVELERLYLEADFYFPNVDDISPDRAFWLDSFPGMLLNLTNTDDEKTVGGSRGRQRPRYLHLLDRLAKLRVLDAWSLWMTKDVAIGMEESKWMEKHWPVLEKACI